MTKKDYILIARILAGSKAKMEEKAHATIVDQFAVELARGNPLFDTARFRRAGGVVLESERAAG